MADEGQLLKSAIELAQALNRAVDESLPQKLAGIVRTHSALAVGSAFVPIPGADMAAAAANIWTMYVRINREINLPFKENFVKSVAAGVVTNIGSAAAGFIVVGSALKLMPGLGTFGGAVVMATTIYAVTTAAGVVYMKAVTKLLQSKKAGEFTEADLKAAADEVMKDKDTMKDIIKEGKAAYKNRKETEAKMTCPKCGLQYPPTELFCALDGFQLAVH